MNRNRSLLLSSLLTGLTAFVVYLLTIAPSMDFIDAGELSAVAHTFGIAHPTGYPLFTILAGLWSYLPLGDGIFRLNLFAALLSALSVGLVVPLIYTLLDLESVRADRPGKSAGKSRKSTGKRKSPKLTGQRLSDRQRLLVAVFGALTAAFSQTFWSSSLAIEVYALHKVFLVTLLWLFTRSVLASSSESASFGRRWLMFAFVLGLSFTNHMSTVYLAPAFLLLFFMVFGVRREAWMNILKAVPAFLAGLLPYLYLPIRAASNPALNWGNPDSLERIIWHLSGKQYSVWMKAEAFKKQLAYFAGDIPLEFAYLTLVFIVAGGVYAFLRDRRIGWFLLLLFTGSATFASFYDIHDIDSYFLLAYLVAAIWAAYGFALLLRKLGQAGERAGIAVGVVVIGIVIGMHFGSVSQSENYLVEDYTRNMFDSFEQDAIVISYQWDYWVSASYYYQHVEGLRPDVTVFDKELFRRSWYLEQWKHNDPNVYAKSKREIETYAKELFKFEHDLPYDASVIEAAYNAMINSIIERNYPDRPIYLTVEMEQQFGKRYERVPEGLAFRLYLPADVPGPDHRVRDDFAFRPYEGSGRLINGLLGMYATMLSSRGVFLSRYGRYREAEAYYNRALEFAPGDMRILQWKAKNEAAMKVPSIPS